MRIRANDPDSLIDVDGSALLMSTSVQSITPASRAWGEFATNDLFYSGFDEDGLDGADQAEWAGLGRLPRNLFGVLTTDELALLYPEGDRFRKWARFTRAKLDLADLPVDQGLIVEWDPVDSPLSGWVPPHFPGTRERVFYFEGAYWVLTPAGILWVDFSSDQAAFIGTQGTRYAFGLDPEKTNPFGDDLDPGLSVPGPPQGIAFRKRAQEGGGYTVQAAVLYQGGVQLFEYPLTMKQRPITAVQVLDDGIAYSSGLWDAGRWLFFGSLAGVLTGKQVSGDGQVSDLRIPRLSAQAPQVQKAQWLWVSADRGIVRSRDGSRWEFLAGIKRDDLGIDPRYQSIDRCESITDFAIERGVPAVLLKLKPSQGGGSMLNVLDPSMRQIVYRRRYVKAAKQILPSPTPAVSSRRVTPGRTITPRFGLGPEDL